MIRATIALLVLAVPAHAGDASGFDPATIDTCLQGAETQGARADCAGTGMEACLGYAQQKYTGDDPDFPMLNCLDASHQAWEAKLTGIYTETLKRRPEAPLRAAERSWISFRDALCALSEGDKVAKARCIRDETARQAALLISLED